MSRTSWLDKWYARHMQDPEFAAAIEELEPEYQRTRMRFSKALEADLGAIGNEEPDEPIEPIKKEIELRNESPHEFKKIVGRTRHYEFPGGETVKIKGPRWLHISGSGGHRIVDDDGVGHYIPTGWIHLWWTVAHFEPHFTI